MKKLTLILLIVTLGLSQTPEFDGLQAFDYLVMQCDLGPRTPDSDSIKKVRNIFFKHFSELADTVFWQDFTEVVPLTGDTVLNRNLIIQFIEKTDNDLLIAAHYDCRPIADNDSFGDSSAVLGANDAASGVAVLMALAENLAEKRPPIDITFVLFDLEDSGKRGYSSSYCIGSQFFANHIPLEKPKQAIVLDMVADAQAQFKMEVNSLYFNKKWTEEIWYRAENLNLPEFVLEVGQSVFDDHVPLIRAGIPTVDIIDFEYPDATHKFWHSSNDIPENCSWETLQSVGTLMLDLIYKPVKK